MSRRKPKINEIFLSGATKLDRKGNAIAVESILAPEPDSCCQLDCCTKAIIFLDTNNVKRSISLQAIYDLLNP